MSEDQRDVKTPNPAAAAFPFRFPLAPFLAVAIAAALVGMVPADDEERADDATQQPVEVATLPDSAPEFADTPAPPAEEGTTAEAAPEEAPTDGDPAPEDAQPSPQETPAASPTPTPVQPPEVLPPSPFRFESPFSLTDCVTILRAVVAGLQVDDGVVFARFERTSMRRAIEVVMNYLKARDDLHYNLVDYRWERVGTDSVTAALIQQLRFEWQDGRMPSRVDAFSLEALHGDVYLHSMMVYDAEGELVADYKFDGPRVMRLRHSLPRREVLFLWRPTQVGRVELAVSRFDPLAPLFPQVQLHAGRTDKPEHGKATIYFLSRAEQDLAADRLSQARADLQHALRELVEYERALRAR